MAKIANHPRMVPHLEDSTSGLSEHDESWNPEWISRESRTGEVGAGSPCLYAEQLRPNWHWGKGPILVTPCPWKSEGISIVELIDDLVKMNGATGDLLFRASMIFPGDITTGSPTIRAGTKVAKPSIGVMQFEENPIVFVKAPVRNRFSAKFVAKKPALFGTNLKLHSDDLD